MNDPRRHEARSVALIVASALLFSTGGLFVRSLHESQPWNTVFWRSVSGAVSIAAFMGLRDRRGALGSIRAMGRPGLAVAACFASSSIGMVVALTRTPVALVLVIFALAPLATALLAWAAFGIRVRGYTWAAIVATVLGVGYMVSGPGATATVGGVLISLTIPLSFAVGAVVIRRHSGIQMVPAMLLACLISAVISLFFADPLAVDRHDLIVLCVFGFAQLGIGLALFATGAAGASATETALLSMLEPVLGPVWVWLFRDEYPGVSGLVGGGLVFVTLALHTIYNARRLAAETAAASAVGDPVAYSGEPCTA